MLDTTAGRMPATKKGITADTMMAVRLWTSMLPMNTDTMTDMLMVTVTQCSDNSPRPKLG